MECIQFSRRCKWVVMSPLPLSAPSPQQVFRGRNWYCVRGRERGRVGRLYIEMLSKASPTSSSAGSPSPIRRRLQQMLWDCCFSRIMTKKSKLVSASCEKKIQMTWTYILDTVNSSCAPQTRWYKLYHPPSETVKQKLVLENFMSST